MSILSHLSPPSGGRRSRNAGISLPFETLKILDELRGDVPKSTFTLRLIERALNERIKQQESKLVTVHEGKADQTNPQKQQTQQSISNTGTGGRRPILYV